MENNELNNSKEVCNPTEEGKIMTADMMLEYLAGEFKGIKEIADRLEEHIYAVTVGRLEDCYRHSMLQKVEKMGKMITHTLPVSVLTIKQYFVNWKILKMRKTVLELIIISKD